MSLLSMYGQVRGTHVDVDCFENFLSHIFCSFSTVWNATEVQIQAA